MLDDQNVGIEIRVRRLDSDGAATEVPPDALNSTAAYKFVYPLIQSCKMPQYQCENCDADVLIATERARLLSFSRACNASAAPTR